MTTDATRPTDDEVPSARQERYIFITRKDLAGDLDAIQPYTSACAGCGNAFSCTYPDCDVGRKHATLTTPQPHIAAEPGEVEREWIEWRGGPMPVGGDELVEVQFGARDTQTGKARWFDGGIDHKPSGWKQDGPHEGWIIRYRIATLTATEPCTAGEGALVEFPAEDEWNAQFATERLAFLKRYYQSTLRQPSTDRESVIEECAKVALQYARNAYDEGLSEDVVTARFHVANDIFNAIRGLKASSKGGDHG